MTIPAVSSQPRAEVGGLYVSVIIPAYNAAQTIEDTLNSVCAQVCPRWEAVVVDDGSTDSTIAIARAFAEREPRIRVISQPNGGEAAARNAGIGQARYDWLLFLDADDWISPLHLERLTTELRLHPDLDAVHCGSVRVALDGTHVSDPYQPPTGDIFPTLARRAAFPIHACIVRRSLVEAVGRFDPSLRTSPDWDLWQRVARTGARFGAAREVLAYYRMQPHSASLDASQLFRDGLRILKQGHAPDPRVVHPHPAHASGSPPHEMVCQQFYLLSWCAGLMIGSGQNAVPLLELIRDARCSALYANAIAQSLFEAGTLPTCRTSEGWKALWPVARPLLEEFLPALEEQSQTPALAENALLHLEKMILMASLEVTDTTVADLRASIQRLMLDNEHVRLRHADLEAQRADLAARHVDLEARHADLGARHVDLEARHVDLEARHADLGARHADLEAQRWVRLGRRLRLVTPRRDPSSGN